VVLTDFAGQRLGAARSICADLIFCYFFIKEKVMGLRGQERDDALCEAKNTVRT
jgi:hypothetical protein